MIYPLLRFAPAPTLPGTGRFILLVGLRLRDFCEALRKLPKPLKWATAGVKSRHALNQTRTHYLYRLTATDVKISISVAILDTIKPASSTCVLIVSKALKACAILALDNLIYF
jgi:hypothetical protein